LWQSIVDAGLARSGSAADRGTAGRLGGHIGGELEVRKVEFQTSSEDVKDEVGVVGEDELI